jgi:hypothetical protein
MFGNKTNKLYKMVGNDQSVRCLGGAHFDWGIPPIKIAGTGHRQQAECGVGGLGLGGTP